MLFEMLSGVQDWVEIEWILRSLRKRGRSIPYTTVKAALMRMAAQGTIESRKVGQGRRGSWLFRGKEKPVESSASQRVNAQLIHVDPFAITPEQRDRLTPEEVISLYDLVYERYGTLVKSALDQGARYVVLCDGNVVSRYCDSYGPSDEELRLLERKHGKACYVIGADVIEEAAWSQLSQTDYYPTLPIHLGLPDWSDKQVFEQGFVVNADFDTGNPDVAAFNLDDLTKIGIQQPRPDELRSEIHLTRPFYYAWRTLKIGAKDQRACRSISKPCKCLMRWTDVRANPFLLANPRRTGFVGRDVMLGFPLMIILDAAKRTTRIGLL